MVEVKSDTSSTIGGGSGPTLTLYESARALAGVRTALVERKFVANEIRMVGKVEYDETRLGYITARVPGRLDRLFVDYTGVPVATGDHMVYLYSPELLTAQEELLQAAKAVRQVERSALAGYGETAARNLEAVRNKLRLWGLTDQQVADIEQLDKPKRPAQTRNVRTRRGPCEDRLRRTCHGCSPGRKMDWSDASRNSQR